MSAFSRSLALVTALFTASLPLACAESEEPELIQEYDVEYPGDLANFVYMIDGDGPSLEPFTITFAAYPPGDPQPDPNDPEMMVDVGEPTLWPDAEATAAPPTVDRASGYEFVLNFDLKIGGIWQVPVTMTDANGVKDTCVLYFKIRAR
ncbi:MAG: hypothetical protein KC420_09230 [Myxococcales bacterium]|nr:hypothetical protein [Myxococcales bacterium]MCB9703643.1 hypothetical protein [Myxococcales bacterium]